MERKFCPNCNMQMIETATWKTNIDKTKPKYKCLKCGHEELERNG